MSTKAALAKTLENRFKYLTSMERVYAKGTKSYEDLVVKTIEGILGTVRTCKLIKVEDALHIQEMLESSPLPEESTMLIAKAVDARTGIDQAEGSNKDKQICMVLDKYLLDQLWDLFFDKTIDIQTRLLAMAKFLVSIGYIRPTEKTVAFATAIATGPDETKLRHVLVYSRRSRSTWTHSDRMHHKVPWSTRKARPFSRRPFQTCMQRHTGLTCRHSRGCLKQPR